MNTTDVYKRSASAFDRVGEAWQYKVRKNKALEEASNPYWIDLDLTVKNTSVKPVSYQTAKRIMEEYEWLACMPAISTHYYGIFFKSKTNGNEVCGGVVVYGNEYAENLGKYDRYGFTGKMILLARGVCLHWTPKNTGSHLIMESIKLLPPKYEIVTCTVDNLAGEIGTIYQACNFIYVGGMHSEGKTRTGVIIDGKLYRSRSIKAMFGTTKKSVVLDAYPDAQFVKQKSKDRYFYFRGSKKTRKKHMDAIADMIKPYPKRPETCADDTVTELLVKNSKTGPEQMCLW